MDFVPIFSGVFAQADSAVNSVGPQFAAFMESLKEDWFSILTLGIVLAATFWFLWRIGRRLITTVEESVFSNWRLALLGSTGLVLSIASGWTTWDGMRNFTGEPALSFMITFGIQGVMLIVAWLIGESFATGMHSRGSGKFAGIERTAQQAIGIIFGFAIFGLIAYAGWQLLTTNSLPYTQNQLMIGAAIVAVAVLVALLGFEIAQPYIQSSRIIVRNAVLWVMFLSCMATSVFFSFDSLFSTIFPASERERAAELRAQNQVSGILADISQAITAEQLVESQNLFTTDGWRQYEGQLDELASTAQSQQGAIEAYFVQKMEERRRGIAEQQERKATAESQTAALSTKKVQLAEELNRLQQDRPGASNDVVQQVQVVTDVRRRMDEQRALMLAEEKGVEGSGIVGRGKKWREARDQLGRIEAELQVAQERLRAPRERLARIDQRIASIKGELAQIDGDIAKLTGEAQTADQRIEAARRAKETEETVLSVDPARILPAFEQAKIAFRQEPTQEGLTALQSQCSQLLGAMLAAETTKDMVRAIDCDPKRASEAAAKLFALREGAGVFADRCAGGEKLEQQGSADDLFAFSRKCLSDSGLSSDQTETLRRQINLAELNRDDKAHRFVVTWNAFTDGNRLAYLALGIAIAIDALVFMSGLFGANAVRSPLQDVPSTKPRSAQQLEATIENALLPDLHTMPSKFANARAALHAMQPITPLDGFTNAVWEKGKDTPEENAVRKLLAAGASIGAVANDPEMPGRHLVRPELLEFLSIVAKREFLSDKSVKDEVDVIRKKSEEKKKKAEELERANELRPILEIALEPHVGDHSRIVLNNIHPMDDHGDGYMGEILMADVPELQAAIVRRAVNAASTAGFVRQRGDRKARVHEFDVHKQFFLTLSSIASANPMTNEWREDAEKLAAFAAAKATTVSQPLVAENSEPKPKALGQNPSPDKPTNSVRFEPTPLISDQTRDAPGKSLGPDERAFQFKNEGGQQGEGNGPNSGPGRGSDSTPTLSSEGDGNGPAAQAAKSAVEADAFYLKMVDHFANELNYGEDLIEQVMDIGSQLDPRLLRDALTKVIMHMPVEGQNVNKANRSLGNSIESIFEAIPYTFGANEDERRALYDFKENLKSYRTLILLSPNEAYRYMLQNIAANLHSDVEEGQDDELTRERLKFVKTHLDELEAADLSTPEGWDAVEQSLRRFEGRLVALSRAA